MPERTISTEKAPKAIGPYSQAGVAGGPIFTSGQVPAEPKTQPLRVSMIPTTDPGKATREMQPLVDHLARRTGGEVQMTIPTNYAAVVEALRQRLMNQVAHEVAVVGQRTASREAGVQLVEERDALLAILPAEQHRPTMQLAAEVDEAVGR